MGLIGFARTLAREGAKVSLLVELLTRRICDFMQLRLSPELIADFSPFSFSIGNSTTFMPTLSPPLLLPL